MQTELIKQEIKQITASKEHVLFENHKFVVFCAYAKDLPETLPYIGKLREENFRMAGEGTGNDIDIDQFDEYYIHVIAWNKKLEDVSGAVRLGEMTKFYKTLGASGIYTCLEFEFSDELFAKLDRTIEMSRLFVNTTGQKNYFGLFLIFSGVANWLVRNGHYTHLLGSVSISKLIPAEIHGIIIEFCRKNFLDPNLSKLIRAYKPATFSVPEKILEQLHAAKLQSFDELDKFVEQHYGLKNQVPILFKKYHLFATQYLSFGIDDDFSSVTDPLIHTDFANSDPRALSKFVDKDLFAKYLQLLEPNL